MHPQLGRPPQLGSHAHPCPLLPTEQKKPLKQIASPQEKHEPSSHWTPPPPSSSLGGGSGARALLVAVAVGGLRAVAGAAPPQATTRKRGIERQIFTPLSVDEARPFVKGVIAARAVGWSARACELARRPGHRAAAEYVHVYVKHALPCVGAVVNDDSPPGVGDLRLPRHALRRQDQPAEQLGVGGHGLVERNEVPLRYDERVRGRCRVNVGKSDEMIVFEQDLGGELFVGDLAEKAHHESPGVGAG